MTPKQERFVQEYLIDSNATQAAIRAGYSERTAQQIGSEILLKPVIAAEIQARRAKVADKLDISATWILAKLRTNALRALQEEPVYDKDGNETGVFQYAGNVANKALELLGKNAGMFTDKVDHTHSGEVVVRFAREDRKRTAS